ncbi:DJ-1/PfpI family protein [Streptomyces sp. NPDC058864]
MNGNVDRAGAFPAGDTLGEGVVADFDALALPGRPRQPHMLRTDPDAVGFTRDFFAEGRPVPAIRHAPWLPVEAGVVHGRTLTSWPGVCADVTDAGGAWTGQEVVVDCDGPNVLVSSRRPGDLKAFRDALADEFAQQAGRRD